MVRWPAMGNVVNKGIATVRVPDLALLQARRLVEEPDGYYVVTDWDRRGPFGTCEQALAGASYEIDGAACSVAWDEPGRLAPYGDGPRSPCPICGRLAPAPVREPRLCIVCQGDVTDATGRRVQFFNSSSGGGVDGRYVDSGHRYDRAECYAGGKKCRVAAARMGGIDITLSP